MNTEKMKKNIHVMLAVLLLLQLFQVSAISTLFSRLSSFRQELVILAAGNTSDSVEKRALDWAGEGSRDVFPVSVTKKSNISATVPVKYSSDMAGRFEDETFSGTPIRLIQEVIGKITGAIAAREYWYRHPFSCSTFKTM